MIQDVQYLCTLCIKYFNVVANTKLKIKGLSYVLTILGLS